ncbi:hypothetical protein GCM10027265_06100 [Jatrophihabitans fulvus]
MEAFSAVSSAPGDWVIAADIAAALRREDPPLASPAAAVAGLTEYGLQPDSSAVRAPTAFDDRAARRPHS